MILEKVVWSQQRTWQQHDNKNKNYFAALQQTKRGEKLTCSPLCGEENVCCETEKKKEKGAKNCLPQVATKNKITATQWRKKGRKIYSALRNKNSPPKAEEKGRKKIEKIIELIL